MALALEAAVFLTTTEKQTGNQIKVQQCNNQSAQQQAEAAIELEELEYNSNCYSKVKNVSNNNQPWVTATWMEE